MARYFGTAKISSVHGQAKTIDGRLVVAMFHPAAALHQPGLKQSIEDDFRKLPGLIAQARKRSAADQPPPSADATQLSMF
jgi:DNA polymerase